MTRFQGFLPVQRLLDGSLESCEGEPFRGEGTVASTAEENLDLAVMVQALFRMTVTLVSRLAGDERVEEAIASYFRDPVTYGEQVCLGASQEENAMSTDDCRELVFLMMERMVRSLFEKDKREVPEPLRDYLEGAGYLAYGEDFQVDAELDDEVAQDVEDARLDSSSSMREAKEDSRKHSESVQHEGKNDTAEVQPENRRPLQDDPDAAAETPMVGSSKTAETFWPIKVPSRPPRTSSNLDGPKARVANWADVASFFDASLEYGLTRLHGVLPILEKNRRGSSFVVSRSRTMCWDQTVRTRHALIVGPTGCGKTTKLVLPIATSDIADPRKTVVVLDSKGGELLPYLAMLTEQYRPGAKIRVLDFRHPDHSESWNPLSELDSFSKVRMFAHRLCYATELRPKNSDSEFWVLSSIKYLAGILWALKEDPDESFTMARAQQVAEMSLSEIKRWASQYPKISGLQSFLEFLDSGSHNAHTALTDLQNRLSLWSDDDVCRVTSRDEIRFQDILTTPTVLVLRINEADAQPLKPLTNAFFTELVEAIFRLAETSPGGRLPIPVSLIIEEFASAVGRIPDFSRFINVVRSRGLSIVASVQSTTQIDVEYGEETDPLLAGFCTKAFFPEVLFKDADYASQLFGSMTVEHREKSVFRDECASYSSDVGHSEAVKILKRPIFTPHEIISPIDHPELGGAITLRLPGAPPFQAFFTPIYRMENLRPLVDAAAEKIKLGAERPEDWPVLSTGRKQAEVVEAVADNRLSNGLPPGITDTRGWTDQRLREHLDRVKKDSLDWDNTTGSARKWWSAFEEENSHRLALAVRLAEELKVRAATVTEFFLAYVDSNTNNIQANLHYLDYIKLKTEEERKKTIAEKQRAERELPQEELVQRSSKRRRKKSKPPLKKTDDSPRGSKAAAELTFVRCPVCRNLVPEGSRCKMCNEMLRDFGEPPLRS